MDSRSVSGALKERKTAEAALKTSFFGSWKPDYDCAAHHFEKAGQLFKLAKSFKESKDCYTEAAKYYESCRVLFSVGKCHEAAAQCCKELGSFKDAHYHIQLAGDFYTQNGTVSTAVQCYNKGAELFSDKLPKEAAALYVRSGELEHDNEHTREAVKCYLGAKKIYAKNKLYSECINVVKLVRDLYIELDNHPQVSKCNLSLVILHLARGDSVAAKQSIEGDVSVVADELIEAVECGDEENIKKLSTHSDIVYLDTEIARIAKYLSQDGAELPAGRTPNKTQHTGTVFKSADNNSASSNLKSQRNDLFSRPNKQNRDELFGRTTTDNSNARNELFSRPTKTSPAVNAPVRKSSPPPSNLEASTNPFEEQPADEEGDSNPFNDEEPDNNNPFAADDDDELC